MVGPPRLNAGTTDLVERLGALVESRRASVDFYADLHPGDARIDGLADFRSLPTFTKEDLLDDSTDASLMFPERLESAQFTVFTSGTSGTAAIVPRSAQDFQADVEKCALMEDYAAGNMNVLLVHNANVERQGVRPMFDGDPDRFYTFVDYRDVPLAAEIARIIRPGCLWTSPTVALKLGRALDDRETREAVHQIILAGEPLSGEKQDRLAQLYPNADTYLDYGAQELGRLGYQCAELAGTSCYHGFPDHYLYEVLEPGTDEPAGEEGELVVTNMVQGTGTPLTRYRLGDRVRIEDDACGCDEPAFRVLGREQFDRLKIAGITVYREHFEDALATVSDLVRTDYQIHLSEEEVDGDAKTRFAVRLVPRTDADREEFVREEVAESIMENFTVTEDHSWADAVERGWLLPIDVTFVDAIEGEAKTKPVVDHRSDD